MYGTEVFFFSVCCFCCWFFRYLWLVIWMQQHEIYRMPVKCVVNPIAKRWGNSNFTLFPTNSEEHLISSPFRGNWEWTNGIFHIPECIPKSCSWKFLFFTWAFYLPCFPFIISITRRIISKYPFEINWPKKWRESMLEIQLNIFMRCLFWFKWNKGMVTAVALSECALIWFRLLNYLLWIFFGNTGKIHEIIRNFQKVHENNYSNCFFFVWCSFVLRTRNYNEKHLEMVPINN